MTARHLRFRAADVSWFLSIDADTLPQSTKAQGKSALRTFAEGEKLIELSEGFEHLHNLSYAQIHAGSGFTIEDVLPSLQLVWQLRNAQLNQEHPTQMHPLCQIPQAPHPFLR
jgi:UDP-N-acetyl-2-amino-2-deoxyglucuronate dehydrogenase